MRRRELRGSWVEPPLTPEQAEAFRKGIPPSGPSPLGVQDAPSLDPIRAHALLCAATYLGALHATLRRDVDVPAALVCARAFEAYLRGEPS